MNRHKTFGTYRKGFVGTILGGGTPKKHGHWSRCWFIPWRSTNSHCQRFAVQYSCMSISYWLSWRYWWLILVWITCWVGCTAMLDKCNQQVLYGVLYGEASCVTRVGWYSFLPRLFHLKTMCGVNKNNLAVLYNQGVDWMKQPFTTICEKIAEWLSRPFIVLKNLLIVKSIRFLLQNKIVK